jgi:hypothetical protein
LLYPSAFESLALRDPNYLPLARRVRDGWRRGRVPLPSQIDFGNAIRLGDDAFEAHQLWSRSSRADADPSPLLPTGHRDYPKAGIAIRRTDDRAVYIGYRLGGVVVAYTKDVQNRWVLAFEDSGYLLKSHIGADAWLTRMPGSGRLTESAAGYWRIEADFSRSLHDEVTPFRLIVLRLLNLTVLRFQWLGDLFRKLVVRMLMSGTKIDALKLNREITLTPGTISIVDKFAGASRLKTPGYELWRCRRAIGAHMASSRYFQEQELESLALNWVERQPWPDSANYPTTLSIQTGDGEKA